MADLVLVTGGTGYVGGWCIAKLLEAGYDVRTTVRTLGREQVVRSAVATQIEDARDPHRLRFIATDLNADTGWAAAARGARYVLHVASPLGQRAGTRTSPDDLIAPAVEGTRRVLRAARAAGVERVVMTSSGAAATRAPRGDVVIGEDVWTDPDEPGLTAYRRSKVLAERAAWAELPAGGGTELSTVLPGAIFGPALPGVSMSSTEIIARLLSGAMPAVPRIELGVVDVRDLADLHLLAMTAPAARGERFLATSEVITLLDAARILRSRLGADASRVPTRTMPDVVLRVLGRFNGQIGTLVPLLGRHLHTDADKAVYRLGWRPRPAADTVADTGRRLIELGVVRPR